MSNSNQEFGIVYQIKKMYSKKKKAEIKGKEQRRPPSRRYGHEYFDM